MNGDFSEVKRQKMTLVLCVRDPRETLVSLNPFHMLKSETVVINQHIREILEELKTSEPS